MVTWGQAFAIGIHTGWGWVAMRVNGFSILLGPLAIDVQPPAPKWLGLGWIDWRHHIKEPT